MKYFRVVAVEAELIVVSKDAETAAFEALEICNSNGFTLVDVEPIHLDLRKDYYPNKVETIMKAPSELFEPLEFDDFMEWRGESWELSTVSIALFAFITRKSGKISEKAYKSRAAAINRVKKLMKDENVYFEIATENGIVGYPYLKSKERVLS